MLVSAQLGGLFRFANQYYLKENKKLTLEDEIIYLKINTELRSQLFSFF